MKKSTKKTAATPAPPSIAAEAMANAGRVPYDQVPAPEDPKPFPKGPSLAPSSAQRQKAEAQLEDEMVAGFEAGFYEQRATGMGPDPVTPAEEV